MRVISGTSKGRKLSTPKRSSLRPTSDRVKESLFDILGTKVEAKIVLDLFAGTGNLGIEALSRAAKKAVFVEKNREAVRLVEKNLSLCKMQDRSEVLLKGADDAISSLKRRRESFDLIFMDPPYEKGLVERTLNQLAQARIFHEDSLLVVEHHHREPLPHLSVQWRLVRQRRIGDTVLSFLIPVFPKSLAVRELNHT